jgi:hypothetical protein
MDNNISNKKRIPLKDRQLRYPGQSLEDKVDSLRWAIALHIALSLLFIALAFVEWWQWYRNLPPAPVFYGGVAVVVVIYSSVRILQFQKRLHNYRLGLTGEREVGQILNKLTLQGYTVFHSVTDGKFDIDHVVVSPHGIFAIETKTYSKSSRGEAKVRFDGKQITLTGHSPDAKPVMEAVRHSSWLRQKLGNKVSERKKFPVKTVVVYPGWWRDPKDIEKDIWVLNPGMLEVQISREPVSLTEEDIAIAKARLEPYTTDPTEDLIE